MTIDVAHIVGAVAREVTSCMYEGKPARVIVATRHYNTSIEDLWDALTNPERIPRWFLPISGDLRLGGKYQFQGNAGGEIARCEPPHHLAVTWVMHGGVSWVNVQLSQINQEKVLLHLEHIAHVPDELWDQFGPGAVGVGWDGALFGLLQHLSKAGAEVSPESSERWAQSEEGKRFNSLSSDAWAEASIANGTEPAKARAAAERTTAFYTGG
jgi:uncharacterized protein YndB with AHSA1/START domain